MTDEVKAVDTLTEAQDYIAEGMFEPGGVICPCCNQGVKLYRRKLNSGMARMLIKIWKATPKHAGSDRWLNIPDTFPGREPHHLEYSKLRFWGILEEMDDQLKEERGIEKGARAGYWRITELGIDFVCDRITVPRSVLVYDNVSYGFEDTQKTVNIRQALGDKFDYDELVTI